MTTKHFDIAWENDLIATGGNFWCEGCLYSRPTDDQSPDPRYCQGCYEYLGHEVSLMVERGFTRRPYWWPIIKESPENGKVVSQDASFNLSTLKGEKIKVDRLASVPPTITREEKPGPRPMALPDEKIREWASQGMGSKAIATKLEKEYRVVVSYKTIQRRLQGRLL